MNQPIGNPNLFNISKNQLPRLVNRGRRVIWRVFLFLTLDKSCSSVPLLSPLQIELENFNSICIDSVRTVDAPFEGFNCSDWLHPLTTPKTCLLSSQSDAFFQKVESDQWALIASSIINSYERLILHNFHPPPPPPPPV